MHLGGGLLARESAADRCHSCRRHRLRPRSVMRRMPTAAWRKKRQCRMHPDATAEQPLLLGHCAAGATAGCSNGNLRLRPGYALGPGLSRAPPQCAQLCQSVADTLGKGCCRSLERLPQRTRTARCVRGHHEHPAPRLTAAAQRTGATAAGTCSGPAVTCVQHTLAHRLQPRAPPALASTCRNYCHRHSMATGARTHPCAHGPQPVHHHTPVQCVHVCSPKAQGTQRC